MRAGLAAVLAAVAILLCTPSAARAQSKAKPEPLPPGFHAGRLLAGPDHMDFKCDMALSPARLTFQLRYLVRLRATLDPGSEDRTHKLNLFFVVMIADANGNWIPKQTHTQFALEPGFDKDNAIEYLTGFYVKPGKYTAALMVYDAVSGKTDLLRKAFEVKATDDKALPGLSRDVPPVEFIDDVPTDKPPVQAQTRYFRTRNEAEFTSYHPEDEWPPATGAEYLPVENTRPLLVDIVLNVAPPVDPYMQREMPASLYRLATGITVQAGALLSHLQPHQGCVRVSAIDLSKLDAVFGPVDAKSLDWSEVAKQLDDRNNNATISVRALTHRTDTADFLAQYLRKISEEGSSCGGEGPAGHAIVFVSREFDFPSGTRNTKMDPEASANVRYIQVRLKRYGSGDDLAGFFKPVKAERIDASSPEQFREGVAKLVADLAGLAKQ